MKTAEEWDKFFSERYDRKKNPEFAQMSNLDFFKDMCQQIQLDAMREGMRRAHAIQQTMPPSEHWECGKAILTAAEQLTEKDLEV